MRRRFTEEHISRYDDISGEPSKLVRKEYKDGSFEWFRKSQRSRVPVADELAEVYEEEFRNELS